MAQIMVKCGHLLKHTAERCLAVNQANFGHYGICTLVKWKYRQAKGIY